MLRYSKEKICKKLNLLLAHKDKLLSLETLLNDSFKYLEHLKKLSNEIQNLPVLEEQVNKDIESIKINKNLDDHLRT